MSLMTMERYSECWWCSRKISEATAIRVRDNIFVCSPHCKNEMESIGWEEE